MKKTTERGDNDWRNESLFEFKKKRTKTFTMRRGGKGPGEERLKLINTTIQIMRRPTGDYRKKKKTQEVHIYNTPDEQ